MNTINELARAQHSDSERWFPSVHQPVVLSGHQHAVMHFALGASGEVGEIVNKVKKHLGYGDHGTQYSTQWLLEAMQEEIPDAIVYLLDLAAELDIDLDTAMRDKRGICMGRWEKGYTWDSVPVGHVVPGSGEILSKLPHVGGWHLRFRRVDVFPGEEWSRYAHGADLVPVAITSHGLVYPNRNNVV